MNEELIKNDANVKEEMHITYYFTVIFTVIGTLLLLYFLSNKVEKLSLFIIFLSISAGGLPIGVIGAFIDYKISEYKLKLGKTV
ncbi:hypothetical protein [Psychrobacillus vulpis]|uniref:MFS transporter n=1 Tax=Psychrobacillus vulpis TaxID=2325572 RepID=A0A544TTD4_9BACI|nr:hypothetical protein [Psychrobacillus vulpis]TQR20722.1 hypothetical protein FG384_06425 [Psychrobacillus vulpis]